VCDGGAVFFFFFPDFFGARLSPDRGGGVRRLFVLLTHADALLYLQLHTLQSAYTVHAANPC